MSSHVSVRVRPTRLMSFSSAVISSLMSLAGALLLVRIVWQEPWGHIWGVAGFALLLLLLVLQLWRIHALYGDIDKETIESVPLLRRAVNETMRTYTWGNGVFLLLALAVFQFHLLK